MLVAIDNEYIATFGPEEFHISCMLREIMLHVCITGYTCAHLAAAHGKRSVLEAIMKGGVVSSGTCTNCLELQMKQPPRSSAMNNHEFIAAATTSLISFLIQFMLSMRCSS